MSGPENREEPREKPWQLLTGGRRGAAMPGGLYVIGDADIDQRPGFDRSDGASFTGSILNWLTTSKPFIPNGLEFRSRKVNRIRRATDTERHRLDCRGALRRSDRTVAASDQGGSDLRAEWKSRWLSLPPMGLLEIRERQGAIVGAKRFLYA